MQYNKIINELGYVKYALSSTNKEYERTINSIEILLEGIEDGCDSSDNYKLYLKTTMNKVRECVEYLNFMCSNSSKQIEEVGDISKEVNNLYNEYKNITNKINEEDSNEF